jgi:anti-anti-sigma factor
MSYVRPEDPLPEPGLLPVDSPNILRLEGIVDVRQARRVLESAKTSLASSGEVIVDCGAVERLDASAVQILLALKRSLEASDRTLRLDGAPERVSKLLLLTGMGRALDLRSVPAGPR